MNYNLWKFIICENLWIIIDLWIKSQERRILEDKEYDKIKVNALQCKVMCERESVKHTYGSAVKKKWPSAWQAHKSP